MKNKFYPLEGLFHKKNIMAKATGEFRPPKKGEYYLSGAIPEAYLAPNDLGIAYYIARPVKVKKTIITVIEEIEGSAI